MCSSLLCWIEVNWDLHNNAHVVLVITNWKLLASLTFCVRWGGRNCNVISINQILLAVSEDTGVLVHMLVVPVEGARVGVEAPFAATQSFQCSTAAIVFIQTCIFAEPAVRWLEPWIDWLVNVGNVGYTITAIVNNSSSKRLWEEKKGKKEIKVVKV